MRESGGIGRWRSSHAARAAAWPAAPSATLGAHNAHATAFAPHRQLDRLFDGSRHEGNCSRCRRRRRHRPIRGPLSHRAHRRRSSDRAARRRRSTRTSAIRLTCRRSAGTRVRRSQSATGMMTPRNPPRTRIVYSTFDPELAQRRWSRPRRARARAPGQRLSAVLRDRRRRLDLLPELRHIRQDLLPNPIGFDAIKCMVMGPILADAPSDLVGLGLCCAKNTWLRSAMTRAAFFKNGTCTDCDTTSHGGVLHGLLQGPKPTRVGTCRLEPLRCSASHGRQHEADRGQNVQLDRAGRHRRLLCPQRRRHPLPSRRLRHAEGRRRRRR